MEEKKVYVVMGGCVGDMGIYGIFSNKTAAQKQADYENKRCKGLEAFVDEWDVQDKYISDEERLERDLIRYGETVSNTEVECRNGYHRIRIIKYNNNIYIHKMLNGAVIEVKKIC